MSSLISYSIVFLIACTTANASFGKSEECIVGVNCNTSPTEEILNLSKAADDLLKKANFPSTAERISEVRATKDARELQRFGLYGEYSILNLATLLKHPVVTEAMNAAQTEEGPTFVDIGSGAGRLMLSASAMANWAAVFGIEGRHELHVHAVNAIRHLEQEGSLRSGMVQSIEGNFMEESPEVVKALSNADVVYLYATGFETHSDARIPALSALLARRLKKGSVVVVVDKFLIGDRFEYDSLWPMEDPDTGEPTVSIIWRVVDEPSSRSQVAEIEKLYSDWMHVDVCENHPKACAELKTAQLSAFGMEILLDMYDSNTWK